MCKNRRSFFRRTYKRWLFGILGIVAIIAAALFGNLSGQIGQIRTLLIGTLVTTTGLSVRVNGPVKLANVLPLTFTVEDLEFGDARQTIKAKKLSLYPRLASVLFGPTSVRRVELEGVEFGLRRRRNGSVFIRGTPQFSQRLPELANGQVDTLGLTEITLRDVNINFEDRLGNLGGKYHAELLNAAWSSTGTPVTLTARGIDPENKTRFDLQVVKTHKNDWQDSDIVGQVETATITAAFDGIFTPGAAMKFDGTVSASGEDLVRSFGESPASDTTSEFNLPWSAEGTASIDGRQIVLTNARINLDGQSAQGAIKVTLARIPSITGTIDLEQLDLTGYLPGIAGKNPEELTNATRRLDLLSLINMDLRLSSRQTRMGAMRLGETAATVYSSKGSLSLSVAETDLAGGRLQANLAATSNPTGLDAEFVVRLKQASAEVLARLFAVPPVFEADFSVDLTGSLKNIVADQPLPDLDGHGSITAKDARWIGLENQQTDQGRPTFIKSENGAINVDSISGDYDLKAAFVLPTVMQAKIGGKLYDVSGKVNFETGESDLHIEHKNMRWNIGNLLSDPTVEEISAAQKNSAPN